MTGLPFEYTTPGVWKVVFFLIYFDDFETREDILFFFMTASWKEYIF